MKLLEPITIRGMLLKNRVVMAPMATHLGHRNERARAYYLERAKGGVGSIILGGFPIDALKTTHIARGLSHWLVEPIHEYGVKIGIQLWHGNQYPTFGAQNPDWVAPSPGTPIGVAPLLRGFYKAESCQCRELTVMEIQEIASRYGEAALRARQAGFDFVELHGCHGHNLPSQFFFPLDNRRRDEYGGDLERRMRFNLDVARTIRKAIGDDFPFFWRLSAADDWPGGITLQDSVELAKSLVLVGVDVIDVSFGNTVAHDPTEWGSCPSVPPKKKPRGTFIPLAEAIKSRVGVPVIGVGRINSHKIAEAILARGLVDLIALGRQLFCDPFWTQKVEEGRFRDIQFCRSCNECLDRYYEGSPVTCKYNLRLGKEWEIP